jgi:hypothetical protein
MVVGSQTQRQRGDHKSLSPLPQNVESRVERRKFYERISVISIKTIGNDYYTDMKREHMKKLHMNM